MSVLSMLAKASAIAFAMAISINAAAADKLQEILDRGHVIIGTSGANPPFGFKDEKGELQGFDIEISRMIAKALFDDPTKVEFKEISMEARWSSIQTDQVDAIVMITTITPERLRKVGFTPPYIDSGMAVIARKDSGVTKLGDLDDASRTVATLTVPDQIDTIKRWVPKATIASFDTVDQQFLALQSGRAQSMLVDLPVGMWYASKDPNIHLVPGLFDGYQNYGIAYKLGELSWKQFMDGFVTELTTGTSYYLYNDLYKKYFNMPAPPQRSYAVGTAQ